MSLRTFAAATIVVAATLVSAEPGLLSPPELQAPTTATLQLAPVALASDFVAPWQPTESGTVSWRDLKVGTGEAIEGDTLERLAAIVHLRILLPDGTVIDDTLKRRKVAYFLLGRGQMPVGFEQAIRGLREGGRRQVRFDWQGDFQTPAYSRFGWNTVPEDSPLIVEVTLVDVRTLTPPPTGPTRPGEAADSNAPQPANSSDAGHDQASAQAPLP